MLRWIGAKLLWLGGIVVVITIIAWVGHHPHESAGAVKHQGNNVTDVIGGIVQFVVDLGS